MGARKFTPGPWWFSNGDLLRVGTKGRGLIICGVHKLGRLTGAVREEEAVANGKLIAAAPDLYDALVAVSDMLFQRPDMMAKLAPMMGPAENAVAAAAADALRKARGGP
jgi:hypothetical protein